MNLRNLFLAVLITALMLVIAPADVSAQCPMCKASVESAMKDKNNTKGKGLNNGILYLLSVPYLVVGTVGVIWYRRNKAKKHARA